MTNGFTDYKISMIAGTVSSAKGLFIDTINSKMANGWRDTKCKFYYSHAGGSMSNYLVKRYVIGGAVAPLLSIAKNEFKSWATGKKKAGKNKNTKQKLQEVDPDLKNFGSIDIVDTNGSKAVIYALDDWGYMCPDALMLGIETDTEIAYTQRTHVPFSSLESTDSSTFKGGVGTNQTVSKTLVWYDTTALINISSDKNMVVTQVQGRDFSRKELISNGDIKFSVSGQITSKKPDVYPTHEVQKFLKVMQYKGVVRAHNQLLSQFGITHIVIDNFSLNSQEGSKSVQRYSFSAIGLQCKR